MRSVAQYYYYQPFSVCCTHMCTICLPIIKTSKIIHLDPVLIIQSISRNNSLVDKCRRKIIHRGKQILINLNILNLFPYNTITT